MEGNTFSRLASFTFLFHLLLFFILLSQASACNNSTIDPPASSNSYQTNKNTNINPNSYSQNTKNNPSPNQIAKNYKAFVFTSCNASTYPSICYQYLSDYASKIKEDPFKLCNSSLSVVLTQAKKSCSVISDLLNQKNSYISGTAAKALKDCLSNVKSSIGEVKKSLDDMNHLYDSYDKKFQMSTIKTYVSAAITDHETCFDGLDEEKVDASVRDKVRSSVLNVQRMTSNSLYFINNLKY
ncbi:hypothetical protein QN277_001858 [Acacia crassicarpa]|uniref:Pectinesterase inhibitor domain-containing protein n=1 Tax=Acacia crassicarpa TaxID=499986 RepID=A0AAE1N9C9_9FABA|nr:hypothetical protein QN277_001858 [Acacia crassicarpa]